MMIFNLRGYLVNHVLAAPGVKTESPCVQGATLLDPITWLKTATEVYGLTSARCQPAARRQQTSAA